jgi:transposase
LEKKLATEVEQLQTTYPDAEIQLWCEDEHRLGLKPIIRRIYVPEGETPIANVNWRFKWLWLYAFAHPQTGETYWWILPYVNTELFNLVLEDFAREFGLGANKHILLVVDRAGWHTSHDLELPEGLHLTLLPSHSPELQPAERLWTIVDEPIVNRSFETLDDLEEVLFHRCQSLLQQQDLIRGLTGFHWWTQIGV